MSVRVLTKGMKAGVTLNKRRVGLSTYFNLSFRRAIFSIGEVNRSKLSENCIGATYRVMPSLTFKLVIGTEN